MNKRRYKKMEIEKIDLRYAEFISDVSDNINNIRTRIIKFDNKLYYHQMYNGEVIQCFELKSN